MGLCLPVRLGRPKEGAVFSTLTSDPPRCGDLWSQLLHKVALQGLSSPATTSPSLYHCQRVGLDDNPHRGVSRDGATSVAFTGKSFLPCSCFPVRCHWGMWAHLLMMHLR